MTTIGSSRTIGAGVALMALLVWQSSEGLLQGEQFALTLHASAIGAAGGEAPWTIELSRWSTEAERTPIVSALSPPASAPSGPAVAEGRGPSTAPGAGRAGRAGRGPAAALGASGRGGRGTAPANPLVRLTAAVKAAPTVGFIWGGVTGYSIKYAWRAATAGTDRIVLITERRFGSDTLPSAPTGSDPGDAEFTLIELRVDSKGVGEGRTSLTTNVVVDAAAHTLALDGYQAAPIRLKVTQ